eukprot:10231479-Alexandrium_andersonii.AAC.1
MGGGSEFLQISSRGKSCPPGELGPRSPRLDSETRAKSRQVRWGFGEGRQRFGQLTPAAIEALQSASAPRLCGARGCHGFEPRASSCAGAHLDH